MEGYNFPIPEDAQRELDQLRPGLPRNRMHRAIQNRSTNPQNAGLLLGVLALCSAVWLMKR
jgi:hypothetical protein